MMCIKMTAFDFPDKVDDLSLKIIIRHHLCLTDIIM